MENPANFSVNYGPNVDSTPSAKACEALGLLLGELTAGFEPPLVRGPDLGAELGNEWQYGGEEVTFVVEAADFAGQMWWVYPSGLCICTTLAEQPITLKCAVYCATH